MGLVYRASRMEFECDAVLLDMDGVLVDSTACERRQWSAWARLHGLDPDSTYVDGIRTIDQIRLAAPHLDVEAESRAYEEIEVEDTEGIAAYPGAMKLVTSIPSGRWAVVTSGIRPVALARLNASGLPVPETLIGWTWVF
jgi:mannitol-1-/sugar-/sorbitol-6-phosphatase